MEFGLFISLLLYTTLAMIFFMVINFGIIDNDGYGIHFPLRSQDVSVLIIVNQQMDGNLSLKERLRKSIS